MNTLTKYTGHRLFCLSLTISGLTLALPACHTGGSGVEQPVQPPLSEDQRHLPANALRGLTVGDDSLSVGLFAAEPMLVNPTNMDIDARGRVWICEGFNYRNQVNPQNPYRKEGDRIVILEDTTGDGIADKQTVFYQGPDIDAALGIAVLGNKVIVSRSPNVYIFTDEDGDGKADRKDTLFTAIGGIQHDHAIHSFNFGPDGRLYFNFGNAGDSIRDRHGKVIHDLDGNIVNGSGHPYRQGMVFRCKLDGSDFEVLGNNFRNNYEVTEDSYGTMWQSDNDDDGNRGVRINYVMPYGNYGYTDEMTGASWGEPRINREDSIPYRHWHLNDPGVVPNLLQTGAGSPTGILVYEGSLLPAKYHNQLIHADAGPNIVRSYAVTPSGAGYTASINNIVQGANDNWFRPSDVCVAPDGSLFIADWYDPGVGGHQMGDLSRGRIFRVTPKGYEGYKIPSLDLSTPAAAVAALQNPNIATRYLAWEKLHGWGDQSIPALDSLFHSDNPRFRARALWLLCRLPAKGLSFIQEALKDKDENIRITGLRAGLEIKADTLALVGSLLQDPSPAVRREAVIALRHNTSPQAAADWAQLALQYDGKDRWYLEALGIGADSRWDADWMAWMKLVNNNWDTPAGRDIVWRARTAYALPMLTQLISDPAHDPGQYLKFFRAFDFHPEKEKQAALLSLLEGHHPQQDHIDALVLLLLNPAKTPASPSLKKAQELGLKAVQGSSDFLEIIRRYHLTNKETELLELAKHGKGPDLQAAALQLLLSMGGTDKVRQALQQKDSAARKLIDVLGMVEDKKNKEVLQSLILDKNYGTEGRMAAIRAMGKDWSGEDRLFALAKDHKLSPDLEAVAATVLSNSNRDAMRRSAAKYLKGAAPAAENTIAPIKELVAGKGNPAAGSTVFMSYCSACHQVNQKGVHFGPDLSEIGSKLSKEALYAAILKPSEGISFGFEGFTFKLKNGNTLLGYVESQTEDEITIKMIGGQSEKHKKSEVLEKKDYGRSLMPEGLPQAMGQQKFVDLVEYLSALKKK